MLKVILQNTDCKSDNVNELSVILQNLNPKFYKVNKFINFAGYRQ